jgi:hypothetical protein
MPFLYDAEAQRTSRRTTNRLFAVGALFTSSSFTAGNTKEWIKDGPRWFVMANSHMNALRMVIQANATQIAACWTNATLEKPQLPVQRDADTVHDGSCERILFVSLAEDCTLPAPRHGDAVVRPVQETVTVRGIEQTLTFKFVRLS